jgi:hypothetical protein
VTLLEKVLSKSGTKARGAVIKAIIADMRVPIATDGMTITHDLWLELADLIEFMEEWMGAD